MGLVSVPPKAGRHRRWLSCRGAEGLMADGGIVGKQRLPWLEDLVEVRAWGKR